MLDEKLKQFSKVYKVVDDQRYVKVAKAPETIQ
jgi:hypothetical protein